MKTNQNTFMRYEIKYLVTAQQRQAIMYKMNEYMNPDEYGKSTICNVYYDTPDMCLARRSIEKPLYKEKLRVRSYGSASADDMVFVELKKKYDEVVYKRRVAIREGEAEKYLAGKCACSKNNQIVNELDYFLTEYKGLSPAAYIAYDREAFYAKDDPGFRITFDDNVLWRDYDLSLTIGVYGKPLLNQGQSLMEIKVSSALPLWLTHLMCQEGIYKINFSKYGNAYKTMMGKSVDGGVSCA